MTKHDDAAMACVHVLMTCSTAYHRPRHYYCKSDFNDTYHRTLLQLHVEHIVDLYNKHIVQFNHEH